MAQQVKAHATKLYNLSSIPQNLHTEGRGTVPASCCLVSTYIQWYSGTHIYMQNKYISLVFKKLKCFNKLI